MKQESGSKLPHKMLPTTANLSDVYSWDLLLIGLKDVKSEWIILFIFLFFFLPFLFIYVSHIFIPLLEINTTKSNCDVFLYLEVNINDWKLQ